MDKSLSTTLTLVSLAFLLAVSLFVVVVSAVPNDGALLGCATPVEIPESTSQEPEIVHPGQKIFKANCSPCHRIHQKLIGPPLAGVLERRDSLWVIKMIRNSSQLVASGDPTAMEVFREYNRVVMTSFSSFSDQELRLLLEYIKLESEREPEAVPSRVKV